MYDAAIIERLARFPDALEAAARIVSTEDARWKPAPEHWSILEICCHLLDEEREDFRVRIKLTFEKPGAAWPVLDLANIAERRNYNLRDLDETLAQFRVEREASVVWLRSLQSPDWSTSYLHPKVGPVPMGELLASWPAHDALHLRQIAKRLHGLAGRDGAADSNAYKIVYAGEWTA